MPTNTVVDEAPPTGRNNEKQKKKKFEVGRSNGHQAPSLKTGIALYRPGIRHSYTIANKVGWEYNGTKNKGYY